MKNLLPWLLLPVGLALIVLSLAMVAYYIIGRGFTELVAEELAEIDYAHIERPSHVDDPAPGTFGDHFAAHGDAIIAMGVGYDYRADNPCDDESTPPYSARCLAEVETHWPLVESVLLATHTEAAGAPEGLRVPVDMSHGLARDGFSTTTRLARFLRIRLESRSHDKAPNAETLGLCLDGLALGRDLGHGTGLDGIIWGHLVLGYGIEGCQAIVARADPALRAEFVRRARIIEVDLASFGHMIRSQSLADQVLFAEASWFSGAERLPPAYRNMDVWPGEHPGTLQVLLVADQIFRFWPHADVDAYAAAANVSRHELVENLERYEEEHCQSDGHFPLSKFAGRYGKTLDRLDHLITAAEALNHHTETGSWPALAEDWDVFPDRIEWVVRQAREVPGRPEDPEDRWVFPTPGY